jgi:hypothetical protein
MRMTTMMTTMMRMRTKTKTTRWMRTRATMMTMRMRMRMRTKMTRWMRTRATPPDNKQDDEPMADAEITVSDEVLDGDGDGEEASEERGGKLVWKRRSTRKKINQRTWKH